MSNARETATPKDEPDSFRLATWDEMQSYLHGIRAEAGSGNLDRIADALEAIAAAIHRHADVHLYVNGPDAEDAPAEAGSLPDGFRGMR
jgi:hypothetical protein